ncbi:MAG: hypothetical protein ABI596_05410 [Pyrinomonadaceae bacterium]
MAENTPAASCYFVLLRVISCDFVDRVLTIRSHTIHEITLNCTEEHEQEFCAEPLTIDA